MKKIFVFILCVLLMFATPVAVFAAEASADEAVTENDSATTDEPTTNSEIPPYTEDDNVAEAPSDTPNWDEVKETISAKILSWLYEHYDKALVSIFLLLSAIWEKSRDKRLNKSMGTLNNNAITVAKESSNFMSQALSNIENASGVVTSYDTRIVALLAAYQQTAEDRARLEKELVEIKNYLQTSSRSNIEFANELADLIALANIPNYKKEELGARHLAAVNSIIEDEKKAEGEAKAAAALLLPAGTEEVKQDVGEEKKD